MMKKAIFVVALLLSVHFVAAQTISDEQVVRIITEQKKSGASEETIAKNLLAKGVTPEQIRRIKAKYEQEQNGLGTVNVSGINRTRGNEKARGEADNFMIENDKLKTDKNRQKELLQNEMSSLELEMEELAEEKDDVYGRNLFNNELLTFEPAVNIPTPADYVLGAGDQVIIDIWGASQQSFDGVISPEGYVVVEGVGPIKLSGLTVADANKYVKETLGKSFDGSSITLSVGSTRSVKVEIVGDVVTPGSYTMSAFSTLFNALYTAGGINSTGTLRDIKVFRNGKQVACIDVYDYIMNGNNTGNIRLQDNDLIVVGVYNAIVNIQGKVKRPMKYEVKPDESLAKLIAYTGGLSGDAYDKNIRVIRKSGKEYSIHTVEKSAFSTFALADGDSIYVDSIIPRFSNMVEIRGAVFHPGMYQVDGNIKTLLDLINAADGLREDAFLARAVMHRRKPDRRLEVLALDLEKIINGTFQDVELRKEDVVFIPSINEMRGQETLKIGGEVNYPGTYEFAQNTTLEDFILQAGGLTNVASAVNIDVFRRVYDPKAFHESDTITKTYTFTLKDGYVIDGTPGFILEPFDQVHVRKSPTHNTIKNVKIEGAVNFAGDYVMDRRVYRLSDLLYKAGGLTSDAYPKGARLYRKMTAEERDQRENVMKQSQIQLYEDNLNSDNDYDVALADSLMNLKLDLGDVYQVAINLEAVMKDSESVENIELRDGDKLIIPQYSATVRISGEVGHPITINYKKGKRLSYYIKRAGGYAEKAKKNGVYAIYMNGGVNKISKSSSKDIMPGCEIVVPKKNNIKKISTTEVIAMTSSVASISTMIATMVSLLR